MDKIPGLIGVNDDRMINISNATLIEWRKDSTGDSRLYIEMTGGTSVWFYKEDGEDIWNLLKLRCDWTGMR